MKINSKIMILAGIILIAAFSRIIPHPPNFTALGAIALFGGAYFNRKYLAFVVPFIALLLTDLIIGFHSSMWGVYISFALIVLIGFNLREKKKVKNVAAAAISASVLFFIITNFAAWLVMPFYSKDFIGLAASYTAAVPFFHYNLLGDLVYTAVLFGSFELAKYKIPQLAELKA
jgi:O-antigen ligase